MYEEARAVVDCGKSTKQEVDKLIKRYRQDGFPAHWGLFETGVLVRKHNDPRCISLMETWWNEFYHGPRRDQLSLTYAMWKLGFQYDDFAKIGFGWCNEPRVVLKSHTNKEKKND